MSARAIGSMVAAVGDLIARRGEIAELCRERGTLRMDWVDAVDSLLGDDGDLLALEEMVTRWRRDGIRHIVWSGMGGSVVAVGVLTALLPPGDDAGVRIHLLDSTDPAALDDLAVRLAAGKGVGSIERDLPPAELRTLLGDVAMVAVSMGVTSEEPVTHLDWFVALVERAGLPPAAHTHVLTVPGSRLEEAATRHGLESRPVHLGGRDGVPGRMSAPTTRVFLLPLALLLGGAPGPTLRSVLTEAWAAHDLPGLATHPERSVYVRLAAELALRFHDGRGRLMLDLPPRWRPLHVWIEQLLEQTLGKDGRGLVVLPTQSLNPAAAGYDEADLVAAAPTADPGVELPLPDPTMEPAAALAAAFLGWQLTAALLGHRAGTNIVDEPAVESYKSRVRALRDEPDVLARAIADGALDWSRSTRDTVDTIADTVVARATSRALAYLDLTVNGELSAAAPEAARRLARLGNDVLGVPVKLRRAPAAYHVSEQCQLDGPPGVVSVRVVARTIRPAALGDYPAQFLHAQAVATWQAMRERRRDCHLVVLDRLDDVTELLGALDDAISARLAVARAEPR